MLSGKDLDVTLIAFDQEDDIEKVEWFTDKANLMTPPGPSLVPEETHDYNSHHLRSMETMSAVGRYLRMRM